MKLNPLVKNFIFVILILLIVGGLFSLFYMPTEKTNQVSLSQLANDINQDKVKKIAVSGDSVAITYTDDKTANSMKETNSILPDVLVNLGADKTKLQKIDISATVEQQSVWSWLLPALLYGILPLLLIGFFLWTMLKRTNVGAGQVFDFTRSRAKIFGADPNSKEKITFKDAAGLKEAKEELTEIVDFLKFPKKYLAMGAKIPRGVLLLGAAGVGKTLLARAVAGEANVPFFSISGSEFVEMFVGVGSARVRDLFATAKKAAPSIIFIDELDAIGRHRGAGIGGGHDEREQTLNMILVEMDGFEKETGVIVFAATNRGDILDPALLRPGRFDRKIILDPPDVHDREEILKIHSKSKPLASNLNFKEIAERTPGFSGADLANVANEAALHAARKNKSQVFQEEFLEAIEKVLLGPERKSHLLSKKEKEIAAYHEAGHALVSSSIPGTDPVRKISIISRGMAGGYTLQVQSEENKMRTKTQFMAEIATLFGGFAAERLKFGEMTTGASNDLVKASELARRIVKEYGMSSLGPIAFGDTNDLVFLGREISEQRNYSESVAEKIDKEIEAIIKSAEKKATEIIKKRKDLLEKIAKTLIEKEIIEREEFEKIIGIKQPNSRASLTKGQGKNNKKQ
ncbi:MAG: cell division protein FtsH [Candidatus Staskawiczbacteria bacterium RIFCSPHIGHO2_02_FULL_34_10]|uniref:ATP-dependent zinc metalloprotease FtsH n=2 Tax=Candidatus Staskawicziibacteriota TaxID=1817916 RepID=A0A1G2HM08_9BACT|nr:MAG: cell division protein FtsH [Candidatus Staskawiczbacteria bacterium RIFCSPHIGHO2_01_FULL_34_27]OGZ66095.1 MAG: cell division protein FtsH [Candidatus Staskawiczbacteria bacterium RIFCSPHIGHO2_02_FULL_34_10]